MKVKFVILFTIMWLIGSINSLFWGTHTNFYGRVFGALLIWIAWWAGIIWDRNDSPTKYCKSLTFEHTGKATEKGLSQKERRSRE